MEAQITNNIISGNYIGVELDEYSNGMAKVAYNDIWSNTTSKIGYLEITNNLAIDPVFEDAILFRITPESPCVDAGDPESKPDPDGTIADIGYSFIWQLPELDQQIPLKKGWNIISFNVLPLNDSLINIIDQLLINETLEKVQDEKGQAIELLLGEWIDNIGMMDLAKGYKVKVNKDDTLNINGWQVILPMDIPFNNGWNLMGYPAKAAKPAINVFNGLLEDGILVKVQDETGASIENIHPLGTINNIVNLKPGEGYKVKVKYNSFVRFYNSNLKTALIADNNNVFPANHFTKAWEGNGIDHMNIYISNVTINDRNIQYGDEIAIFDGEICVGTYVYSNTGNLISIAVSKDDPTTKNIDGYIPGNNIMARIWDAKDNVLITNVTLTAINGHSTEFNDMGTTVLELKTNSGATGVEEGVSIITSLGENYPNPFLNKTNIEFSLSNDEHVTILIYNLLGEKVYTLIDEFRLRGNYKLSWNCLNDKGSRLPRGVYLYRMETKNFSAVKQMIILK